MYGCSIDLSLKFHLYFLKVIGIYGRTYTHTGARKRTRYRKIKRICQKIEMFVKVGEKTWKKYTEGSGWDFKRCLKLVSRENLFVSKKFSTYEMPWTKCTSQSKIDLMLHGNVVHFCACFDQRQFNWTISKKKYTVWNDKPRKVRNEPRRNSSFRWTLRHLLTCAWEIY